MNQINIVITISSADVDSTQSPTSEFTVESTFMAPLNSQHMFAVCATMGWNAVKEYCEQAISDGSILAKLTSPVKSA